MFRLPLMKLYHHWYSDLYGHMLSRSGLRVSICLAKGWNPASFESLEKAIRPAIALTSLRNHLLGLSLAKRKWQVLTKQIKSSEEFVYSFMSNTESCKILAGLLTWQISLQRLLQRLISHTNRNTKDWWYTPATVCFPKETGQTKMWVKWMQGLLSCWILMVIIRLPYHNNN